MAFDEDRKGRRQLLEVMLIPLPSPAKEAVRHWLIAILNENRNLPPPMLEGQLYRAAEALGAKIELDGDAGTYRFAEDDAD